MSGRASGGFLERLDKGPVIGDGGFVIALEKRGYVEAGPWTPEAVIEHPEAVRQLHREFVRAGSDICQAFTFYSSEDKLNSRDHGAGQYGMQAINKAACEIAKEVAYPAGCLVAGGLSQTPTYREAADKESVRAKLRAEVEKQVAVFKEEKVDLMICEYFEHVQEAEWAVEAVKELMPGTPICASLGMNTPEMDLSGVPLGECGVRLVRAGADVVGVNCQFDPFLCIGAVKKMIAAVNEAGLKAHFMVQPLAMWTPDAGSQGWVSLPECPFALEARTLSRFDFARYAREAYNAGIRYLGGCCGTEPYHIRAVSEELQKERGGYKPVNCIEWGAFLAKNIHPVIRKRAGREYWENLNPSTGRPNSAAFSKPQISGASE